MKVIFENTDFIAVDKPPMLLTIPGRLKDKPSLKEILEAERKQKIFVIHRLDYEVSGVLLFAKNAEAHAAACACFEQHEIVKIYEAITSPGAAIAGQKFHWNFLLARGKKRSFESPHGKSAITDAQMNHVDSKSGNFHWTLQPQTGRSHQLRVSLARAGYPIVGDTLYGSKIAFKNGAIALCAVSLKSSRLKIDLRVSGIELA